MHKLEQYTLKKPAEVLIVKAIINGDEDEIIIFKGFSSSLTGKTEFDPDIPVLPDHAKIVTVDRLKSPYNPTNPQYLQQNLSWEDLEQLLIDL